MSGRFSIRHLEDNDLGCQSISGIVSPLSPAGGRVNPCSTQDITFCEWGCVCAHVNAEKPCQRHSASANGPDGFPGRHVMSVFFFPKFGPQELPLPHIAKMGVVRSLCQRRNAPASVFFFCREKCEFTSAWWLGIFCNSQLQQLQSFRNWPHVFRLYATRNAATTNNA